ncbi:hypothetical protein GHT09_007375 [Marmota monax]|uniref:Uncharacterized protein n=1 Tax=Marmota monax TaxID=9995 RepID=A0A834V3H7_MARMO|nr:hypothetical protein GHT09_007375 [Marmota monax]
MTLWRDGCYTCLPCPESLCPTGHLVTETTLQRWTPICCWLPISLILKKRCPVSAASSTAAVAFDGTLSEGHCHCLGDPELRDLTAAKVIRSHLRLRSTEPDLCPVKQNVSRLS